MKFVIDAGHGPNTAGKRSPNGMKEFEFNIAVADFLTNELLEFVDVEVYHTHTIMSDVSLKTRTDLANSLEADCFLSIHANAYGNGWNHAEGIETYVYTSKPKKAYELANLIQARLIKMTERNNRGVKTANFHVLRETKMTAVLIECGFMTNREEAALLLTTDYRKKCASAIALAVKDYYQLQPKKIETMYRVQVGAFSQYENAVKLQNSLKEKAFNAIILKAKN